VYNICLKINGMEGHMHDDEGVGLICPQNFTGGIYSVFDLCSLLYDQGRQE